MIRSLKNRLGFHPRAILDSLLTYPRFLGKIKPRLLAATEAEALAYYQVLTKGWETAFLRAPIGRRLLVLAAHPDDESIGAGGLLLAHRGKCEIHLVNLFNGEGGGRLGQEKPADTPEYRAALASERRKEFEEAARRIGAASLRYLNLVDGQTLPNENDALRLKDLVSSVRPDVVLLPWYLDNQRDHRVTNILYAWGCRDLNCQILGFELWTPLHPNAVFDITDWIDEKARLIGLYRTQNESIDYAGYAKGLAAFRAFLCPIRPGRDGAAEAFFSLPNREYCDLVLSLYGPPGRLNPVMRPLLGFTHREP